jgi:hypothetical protein
MGYVIVESGVWQNQWKPSLNVVLGNGPLYNPATDLPRGRHAQFFVNTDVIVTTRTIQFAPFGAVGAADVFRALNAKVFVEVPPWDNPWRPKPRLVTDIIESNADIFAGNDTYGWDPNGPEPPRWVNEMRGTPNVLQFFVVYNPARDVFLLKKQDKYFAPEQVYWTPQRPIGAWGTTYLPYLDPTQFRQSAKFFADAQVWWDFKQPITGNVLYNFSSYNPATDVTQLRQPTKFFAEPQVYWTPQRITINAITFVPPPYNPATDVRFARPARFDAVYEPTWWKAQPSSIVVTNVTPAPPVVGFKGALFNWRGRVVLSPKKLGEDLIVPMDFISRLAVGETIVTAVAACSVYSGTDPAPQDMLNGAPTVVSTVVEQTIIGGVVGTVYELLYTITTTQGQTLELSGYFAVVPDLP